MRVGLIGAGRIGSNLAERWTAAGHEVLVSFSRDARQLRALAERVGAQHGTVAEAVAFGEALVVSVPWPALSEVVEQTGDLSGRVLIDTTNPYGPAGLVTLSGTAAQANRDRFGGPAYAKAFNTVTSVFQAEVISRPEDRRPAMFLVADPAARQPAEALVVAVGFVPVWLGGPQDAVLLEAPRRDGSVYGEEYRPDDARRIAVALLHGDDGEAARLAVRLKQPG